MKSISTFFALMMMLATTQATAVLVSEHDLDGSSAGSPSSLAASTVDANFTATALTAVGLSSSPAPFNNHFYHTGWDTTLNLAKYYELTINSVGPAFSLSSVDFSLEETGGNPSTFWLRSSLDGYAANLGTGSFSGGLVTDFSIGLAALGVLQNPLTLRWYMASGDSGDRTGFANHEPPGTGSNLIDVGQDLQVYGSVVPVPAAVWLFGTGILGLIGFAKRKQRLPA